MGGDGWRTIECNQPALEESSYLSDVGAVGGTWCQLQTTSFEMELGKSWEEEATKARVFPMFLDVLSQAAVISSREDADLARHWTWPSIA